VGSLIIEGTDEHGNGLQWARTVLFDTDEPRMEMYEEADVDAALERFEELRRQMSRLGNAASQLYERFQSYFTARDWNALAETMAVDIYRDDRRRVVSAEASRGRDAAIAEARAVADIGAKTAVLTVIGIRGERLALFRSRFSGRDQRPEAFHTEFLCLIEVDRDGLIAQHIMFDPDDFEAALGELDARYLAGEAAAFGRTWSVISNCFAALSRHELPATTSDLVDIDHRRVAAFAPGDLIRYLQAGWEVNQSTRTYAGVVHALNNFGAVVAHAADLTSHKGFEAEWRTIDIFTVEGDLIDRVEIFDEQDLDTALAHFEELNSQKRRRENAASRTTERFRAALTARDWDTMAEMLAEDVSNEDRRRVVNAGIRHGRDAELEDLRAAVDVMGLMFVTYVAIATRGESLVHSRARLGNKDRPEAYQADVLQIIGINADERIAAAVTFEADDIDAAIAELEARYIAGEAAPFADTWQTIAGTYASISRRELPVFTPDLVNVDHRRVATFAPGELIPYIHAGWDIDQEVRTYVEVVHQLNNLGAVVTYTADAASHDGFDAEWREIAISTVESRKVNRCELFNETDLDVALARLEELQAQTRRLENAASRVDARGYVYFADRDWERVAENLADDFYSDDRRPMVNVGIRHGRNLAIANMQASAELGIAFATACPIATRGARLVLSSARWSSTDQGPEPFHTAALSIVEINAAERITARVWFDINDIDAAFEELDARYLAGEAAIHADAWSVIARTFAAFNRGELPPVDWVNVDHRRGTPFTSSDLTATIRSSLEFTPDLRIRIEAVHRLSNFGVAITNTAYGTSPEGFAGEWRMIQLMTVEGDRINRLELYDEADIDAALARFEELQPQLPRLENAASRLGERFLAHFAARDWSAMAATLAEDTFSHDRRRIVGAGLRQGREAAIADMQTIVDLERTDISSTVIATRGTRLILSRNRFSNPDHGPESFLSELLTVTEATTDNRIAATISFDVDDIDAAFDELDARYLAGEAAPHAQAWSVIARMYAGFNRHQLPAITPDWANVDHRQLVAIEASDLASFSRTVWDLTPDLKIHMEAVHRLNDLGAVVTHTAHGYTPEGFDAQWRMIDIFTVDNELISRCEMFDEADLDIALARFVELTVPDAAPDPR
jgi:hypothetical protein